MLNGLELHERLRRLTSTRGEQARSLVLGGHALRLEGLDDELALQLDRRWGGFLRRAHTGEASTTLRLLRGGPQSWLRRSPAQGGQYRLEAFNDPGRRVIASEHFAMCAEPQEDCWRVAVTDRPAMEPLERVLDNVCRILAGRLALAQGGFALHAAGVLREGRAHIFAGPSRAGKSTAVALAAPAQSLGDDFSLVLEAGGRWLTCAVPFDNSERILETPAEGTWPVDGIWRLHQSRESRVERPQDRLAIASLMSCVAFPWLFPELAHATLEHVGGLVHSGRFAHLHFNKDAALWETIES